MEMWRNLRIWYLVEKTFILVYILGTHKLRGKDFVESALGFTTNSIMIQKDPFSR